MESKWMCVTGKTSKFDLVNIESFVLSRWEEEIGVKPPLNSSLRWLEQTFVLNFWRVKRRWRSPTHGDQVPVMQTWLTDVAGLGLPRLLKAKMLCCILRILLIWNISHSCSNFLQPTVTNCCFLRKSELVQFTSNRKCIQGWDSADFPCTQKASPAGGWVLEDSYWLIYFSGYLLWMEWWGLHKIVLVLYRPPSWNPATVGCFHTRAGKSRHTDKMQGNISRLLILLQNKKKFQPEDHVLVYH